MRILNRQKTLEAELLVVRNKQIQADGEILIADKKMSNEINTLMVRSGMIKFDRKPDDTKHHRVSVESFSPRGSWRSEVERFDHVVPLNNFL